MKPNNWPQHPATKPRILGAPSHAAAAAASAAAAAAADAGGGSRGSWETWWHHQQFISEYWNMKRMSYGEAYADIWHV